jgi:hypothetical protein
VQRLAESQRCSPGIFSIWRGSWILERKVSTERGEGMGQEQRIFWWTVNDDEEADVSAKDVRKKLLKKAVDGLGGTILDETLVRIDGGNKCGEFLEFYKGLNGEDKLSPEEREIVERFAWARTQEKKDRRLECKPVKGVFDVRPAYLDE